MIDGMTYDDDVTDTTDRTPPLTGPGAGGAETAEQVIRERMRRQQAGLQQSQDAMETERDS